MIICSCLHISMTYVCIIDAYSTFIKYMNSLKALFSHFFYANPRVISLGKFSYRATHIYTHKHKHKHNVRYKHFTNIWMW